LLWKERVCFEMTWEHENLGYFTFLVHLIPHLHGVVLFFNQTRCWDLEPRPFIRYNKDMVGGYRTFISTSMVLSFDNINNQESEILPRVEMTVLPSMPHTWFASISADGQFEAGTWQWPLFSVLAKIIKPNNTIFWLICFCDSEKKMIDKIPGVPRSSCASFGYLRFLLIFVSSHPAARFLLFLVDCSFASPWLLEPIDRESPSWTILTFRPWVRLRWAYSWTRLEWLEPCGILHPVRLSAAFWIPLVPWCVRLLPCHCWCPVPHDGLNANNHDRAVDECMQYMD